MAEPTEEFPVLLHLLIVLAFAIPTTVIGGRLLGVRRGWLELTIAGGLGWLGGSALAGALGSWEWGSTEVVLDTIVMSLLLTMVLVVGFDLLAPPGSLARGEEAGLVAVSHPLRSVKYRVSSLSRYWELIRIARSNGLGRHSVPGGGQAPPAVTAVAIRHTLEQAGGLFIKLGQVASTRDDVLPKEICEELSKLQSSVEPAPEAIMRRQVEHQLGGPTEAVFAEFDWRPLAAGSIAHAYRAQLENGTEVIVKVQRPGLEDAFERDTRALIAVARLVQNRTPLGLSLSPVAMAQSSRQDWPRSSTSPSRRATPRSWRQRPRRSSVW